ncbi:DNA-3-methyladenine glycosylase 2 family protein [Streptomyces sp. NBC_01537]|uniref:DNA-3-methyladenine glycosylase family protein n=1 Tax=Streptomyces sp. NBC_01537 TaxID=2903896 RepID=UPI0038654A96
MHPEQPRLTSTATATATAASVPAQTRGQKRRWIPDGPLNLSLTLGPLRRGPADPAFRVTPDGAIWRASRTPSGPGTIRIAGASGGTVEAEAWGPGGDWLLDGLPALLGADDDPTAFTARHRVVHEANRRNPGLRLTRTRLVLESLIPAILEQKVTSDEAYRAWRLLLRRHGEPAPGPLADRMYVAPDPRTWALIPSWEWHRAGVDNKRASTAIRAVRHARRLEEATALPPADALARLQLIPGIGPWTAAETLQRATGDPDAVTVGDLHLPNIVGYALTGAHRSTDAEMLDLLTPYAGQRHRAARLILLGGRMPPRRAPRMAPGNIAAL